MPPKKKAAEEEEPSEEDKDLLEKELVISYLKSKVTSYQEQSDLLRVENYKLSEQLEDQKRKLKDINAFLVNELKARAHSFAAIQAELAEARKKIEDDKVAHEATMKRMQDEMDLTITRLEERAADSDRKARSAEEYLGMRDELVKEKTALEERMKDMRAKHERQVCELERQHVQDRDKWKKTMAKRIQETKQYMIQLTDNQLELTTKHTIMENEQMSAEIAFQSHQTTSVLEQNRKVEKQLSEMRRNLALSKETQSELAKRNLVYQRAIKNLLSWIKYWDSKDAQRLADAAQSDKLLDELYQELRRHKLIAEGNDIEIEQLRGRLAAKEADAVATTNNARETADFLLKCMDDVRNKILEVEVSKADQGDVSNISIVPGQLKDMSLEQRERVLAFLVDKLNIIEGCNAEQLALVRPTSRGVILPEVSPVKRATFSTDKPVRVVVDSKNTSTALKLPITPPPRAVLPPWGLRTPQVLHRHCSFDLMPPPMVPAATQTSDPHMDSADRLMKKIMQDVRPWGHRTGRHPAIMKPAPKNNQKRPFNTSRGSLATPTGPLPKKTLESAPGISDAHHVQQDATPDIPRSTVSQCNSTTSSMKPGIPHSRSQLCSPSHWVRKNQVTEFREELSGGVKTFFEHPQSTVPSH